MSHNENQPLINKTSLVSDIQVSEQRGVPVIEGHLKTLPSSPGVYRMIDSKGDILYVGKAKNLKKRVVAYTTLERQSNRIRRMISETASMEFVTTHTEAEALLLESNLIKDIGLSIISYCAMINRFLLFW